MAYNNQRCRRISNNKFNTTIMAKSVVAAEITLDSKQAEQSLGSIKTRLKEARTELTNAIENFGEFSSEAVNAAKKVEGLKGTIDDASRLVSSFDGDRKFQAFGNAVGAVANGFAAAQGAMALFGVESKEVEEALLKVNAAMALSQGVNGILEGIKSFKDLGAVIRSTTLFQQANNVATAAAVGIQKLFGLSVIGTGTAFNILKLAIIATGIGALIVLIGVLIANMDKFTDSTETAAEAQDRLTRSTEQANKAFSELSDFYDRESQLNIKRAKAKGASEQELTKLERDAIDARIKNAQEETNKRLKQGLSITESTKAELDARNKLEDFDLDTQIKRREKSDAAARDAANKAAARAKEASEKRMAAEKQRTEDLKKLNEGLNVKDDIASDLEAEAERRKAEDEAVIKRDKDLAEARAKISIEYFDMLDRKRKEDIAKEQADAQLRIDIIGSVSSALSIASDIIGKQTAVGKALAIATALINTYQGATEVLRAKSVLPEPFGTISKIANVAAVIATGIKAIKAITSVKVAGSSGGGGVSAPTITAPVAPQAQTTALNQGQINQIGNAAAVRAFVVESDVSTNSERIKRINRAARVN